MNIIECRLDKFCNRCYIYKLLVHCVSSCNFAFAFCQISCSYGYSQRNTLKFIFVEFPAGFVFSAVVIANAYALLFECGFYSLGLLVDFLTFFLGFEDWDYHNLYWSECRRQYQTLIVRMGHDKRSHQSGGNSPRGCPHIFQFVFF